MSEFIEDDEAILENYHQYVLKKILFIVITAIILFLLFGISLTIGDRDMGFVQVYQIIWDHICGATYEFHSDLWWDDHIVWNTRLPRCIIAIIAGGGLAIGGVAMQSIMKNPLADPYTTGISSASVFGVTVAIILGFTATGTADQLGIIFNAFLFGLIPAFIVMIISRFSNTTPATLILAGVAISYFFGSLTTIVMNTGSEEELAAAYLWQIGTLSGTMWSDLPLMLVVVAVGSIILKFTAKQLNILTLGDESAKSLGINAEGFRMLFLTLLSVMTAAIISFTGIIGFLGLVVPHIARLILGSDHKFLVPASIILGAVVLLAADVLAKGLVPAGELPVGVIMSFIGGPIFLYLIIKQRKDMW